MTFRLTLLKAWLRRVEKPKLARATPFTARADFEKQGRILRDPPFALYLPGRIGGVPVTRASVRAKPGRVLLWCHGGAHVMGSSRTHRAMLARLSALTGIEAVLPDYRLAPEHPFPASVKDMRAVWDGLCALGYLPRDILIGGDSSGGGVALALLAQLLAEGYRPAMALAIAPFTDLTGSGASFSENAEIDCLLPASRLREVVDFYLAGHDPRDPLASPLFAEFPDCPPVFLQVAGTEILRDDTLRMADRLRQFGAEVELDLWDDCPHVWAMFQTYLPEADAALRNLARFIRSRLPDR